MGDITKALSKDDECKKKKTFTLSIMNTLINDIPLYQSLFASYFTYKNHWIFFMDKTSYMLATSRIACCISLVQSGYFTSIQKNLLKYQIYSENDCHWIRI